MNKASSSKKPLKFDPERKRNLIIKLIVVSGFLASSAFMINIYHPVSQITKQPEVRNFNALSYFPLRQGNSWSYTYERGTADSQVKEVNTTGEIVMEVTKTYSHPNYFLAIMHGDPVTCDAAAVYGYLVGSNKVYWIPEESLRLFEKAARDGTDPPMAEIESNADCTRFEMPMFSGLVWGPEKNLFRRDGRDSWQVEKETYAQLGSKKNSGIIKCFEIVHIADSGHTNIMYSPGLGIVKSAWQSGSSADSYTVRITSHKIKDGK